MTTNEPGSLASELATRTVVGLALVALALAGIWLGGVPFWILASLLAIGLLSEWASLMRAASQHRSLLLFTISVPLAIMSPWAAGPNFFALGLLIGAALFILVIIQKGPLAFGIVYCGLPALALLLIRKQPDGLLFAFWTLALVWLCDIGAYFAGRNFGGPRLAPAISPNKTWAGLIGGIGAAAVFGAALHVTHGLPWRLTLATPMLAAIAQAGDLYESWLKRQAGVKDSGSLLPGHGGLMDRLDGLIPVAPIAAFLIMLPEIRGLLS